MEYLNETFTRILMHTKTGKKIYLKSAIGNSCEWTFNKSEAIWFERETDAKSFAKKYFKHFNNYELENFSY